MQQNAAAYPQHFGDLIFFVSVFIYRSFVGLEKCKTTLESVRFCWKRILIATS